MQMFSSKQANLQDYITAKNYRRPRACITNRHLKCFLAKTYSTSKHSGWNPTTQELSMADRKSRLFLIPKPQWSQENLKPKLWTLSAYYTILFYTSLTLKPVIFYNITLANYTAQNREDCEITSKLVSIGWLYASPTSDHKCCSSLQQPERYNRTAVTSA